MACKPFIRSAIAVFVRVFVLTLAMIFIAVGIAASENDRGVIGNIRLAPGDDKSGYDSRDYRTNSLSLELRKGVSADLYQHASKSHLGLAKLRKPELEPDAAQIALGRRLFFDRRLSRNKTMSCAMCHVPEQGFTSNELKRSVGFEGRNVKRNAPSLLNVRIYERLFVDSRESSLVQQVWSPLLSPAEMNNASVGAVIEEISNDVIYPELFEQVFQQPPNMINVGIALAQYQQSLMAADTPFDRWRFNGDAAAMTKQQIRGFDLFTGKASCASCHHVEQEQALFTDQQLHNTGVGYRFSKLQPQEKIMVTLAPGVQVEMDTKVLSQVGEAKENDLGRYEVTQSPPDRWKYRTPTLRNVALTAPYMHNGEFLSLMDVIEFYNRGGEPHPLQSPLIRPLNLTTDEKEALVAFMQSLTSRDVAVLVADAFAAEVSDVE